MVTLDKLKESISKCEIIYKNGYPYFIHPLTDGVPYIEPSILEEVTAAFMEISDLDCDIIVAPEAMGIPPASMISVRSGIPYTIVRKRGYGLPGEVNIAQYTGYSKSDMYINGIEKGDRVIVVDDVLSTGGTMRAILNALVNVIGAEVTDVLVIFEKSSKVPEIEEEFGVKIKSLLKVNITNGKVVYSD